MSQVVLLDSARLQIKSHSQRTGILLTVSTVSNLKVIETASSIAGGITTSLKRGVNEKSSR